MAKKTDDQALKWMRATCLALPDTSEGIHYGEIVFKIGSKLFASCGDKKGPRTIVFRIDPEPTEQLLARDAGFTRYPFEKSALAIKASDVDDWDELRTFVEESYRREAAIAKPVKAAKPAKAAKATPKRAGAKKPKARRMTP
jgi:predicted DNA-binding protein (MmcQ/YjbR family)